MMHVHSGRLVDPLTFDPSEVTVIDIAYSLSEQKRWAGHADPGFTILEHCMAGMRFFLAERKFEHALAFLWHDSGEAFFTDLPRDLKQHPMMRWYREQEHACTFKLTKHFAPEVVYLIDKVKLIDNRSMRYEENHGFPEDTDRDWLCPEIDPLPEWCYDSNDSYEDFNLAHHSLKERIRHDRETAGRIA